ncbi:hypothetical protein H2200_003250 [Cladophialophora chaetospira]|uniref:BZIP domain-containing protein n=1 Tax=Cladophialophora chaetospira TaxID=386627 RepID=A0AA39CMK0_9EURO|nr:hypothetical protein H2200_003250 [Cladophialophora chaetospira]
MASRGDKADPHFGKGTSTAAEKRKLRNRLSQQAFRARQNLEISELRQQLALFSGSESDRNATLAAENQRLRQLLWQSEKKLRSLQATLKGIIDGIAETRDDDHDLQNRQIDDDPDHGEVNSDLRSNTSSGHSDIELLPMNHATRLDRGVGSEASSSTDIHPLVSALPIFQDDDLVANNADAPARPEFLLFPTTSQVQAQSSQSVMLPLNRSLQVMAPSKYSEHILAFEMCAMNYQNHRQTNDLRSLNQLVSSLVSAFIKIAWRGMEAWIHCTNGKETLTRLAAWRIFPSPETLAAVPPAMLPTQLQVAVPHPPVIDWCIFPFLRDKLIQFHSADPALDEICGEIGLAYVVQADLADFVAGAEPLTVYFSIHDIISGMQNNPKWVADDSNFGPKPDVKLPAPDLYTLLHTQEYAQEVYHHLGIGRGVQEYCLDPSLFTKYPHLYEPSAKVAHGVALRSSNKITWPAPRPLDDVAMNCYRRCASYHNDRSGTNPARTGLINF